MKRIVSLFVVVFLSVVVLFATTPTALAGKPEGKGSHKQEQKQGNNGGMKDPDDNGKGPDRTDGDAPDTDDVLRNGHNDNGSGNEVDGDCDDNEGRGCEKKQTPEPTETPVVTPSVTPETTPVTPEVTPTTPTTVEVTPTPEVTPTNPPTTVTEVTPTPEVTPVTPTPVTPEPTPVVITTTTVVTVPVYVEVPQPQTCQVSSCCACDCQPASGFMASPELPPTVNNYTTVNVDTLPIALAIVLAGALIALAYLVKK
jgi:hypothetical protein